MGALEKLSRQRFGVLELVGTRRNVFEACRHRRISRSQFRDYKCGFPTYWRDRLTDRPPITRSHLQARQWEVVRRIVAPKLEHSAWAGNRLEGLLPPEGLSVSALMTQNILDARVLAMCRGRRLPLNLHVQGHGLPPHRGLPHEGDQYPPRAA